jgi:hypothetical protein
VIFFIFADSKAFLLFASNDRAEIANAHINVRMLCDVIMSEYVCMYVFMYVWYVCSELPKAFLLFASNDCKRTRHSCE